MEESTVQFSSINSLDHDEPPQSILRDMSRSKQRISIDFQSLYLVEGKENRGISGSRMSAFEVLGPIKLDSISCFEH